MRSEPDARRATSMTMTAMVKNSADPCNPKCCLPNSHQRLSVAPNTNWVMNGAEQVAVDQARASSSLIRARVGTGFASPRIKIVLARSVLEFEVQMVDCLRDRIRWMAAEPARHNGDSTRPSRMVRRHVHPCPLRGGTEDWWWGRGLLHDIGREWAGRSGREKICQMAHWHGPQLDDVTLVRFRAPARIRQRWRRQARRLRRRPR